MASQFRKWLRLQLWQLTHLSREWGAGQGLAEYGLIIIMVAILVMAILFIFGNNVGTIYSNIIRAI